MTDHDTDPQLPARADLWLADAPAAAGIEPPAGGHCACADRLDADFDCRSPVGHCPRLRWLRRFADRRRQASRSGTDDERAREELERLATALGLPADVTETAVRLFDHAREARFVVGRALEAVAAAAVYAAARQCGCPRPLEEVATASGVDRGTVARTHRELDRELDLGVEPTAPADHLPRIADRLDLPARTERAAGELLAATADRPFAEGRKPLSLVAAAVYAAGLLTDHRLNQAAVSEATGVAEPTISDLYRALLEELSLLDAAE